MTSKIKEGFFTLGLIALTLLVGCQEDVKPVRPATGVDTKVETPVGGFAKGADISWVTEQEAQQIKFYSRAGVRQDIFPILKDQGMNSIRLRVWVNPLDGWCNKTDMLVKARRAKEAGFRIMIDFHYSDSWADPGKQTKPAAWASQDITGLKTSVYSHTADVMTTLKENGITPEWAQIGNETNNGMLWPEGKASVSMANFAGLIQSGYDAVKSVSPTTKVIVHISNGFDNGLFRWIFDGLKTYNTSYDVIGMSLYPTVSNWATLNEQCLVNMNDMVSRYNKEVMVVEVGMEATAAAARDFITDLIAKGKKVQSGKGLGVMYWEPQSYNNWKGYGLGAFDASGKPTAALDAFKD